MATITSDTSLVESGRRLAPLIREHDTYGDTHGELAPAVINAFHEAGMFGMWVPEVLGGSELDPLSSLELVEQVSYEDPATGWVLFAASVAPGAAGVFLPDGGAQRVFGGNRLPAMAGQGTRAGTAVRVEGGHRLSGSWNFASGSRHSDFIFTLAVVEDTHEPRLFVVPVDEVTLVDGSWDVLGLRGTGSMDYEIDDVFVPEDSSYSAMLEEPVRGGPLGRLGLVQTPAIGHSAWATGIGRRLLDEFSSMVRRKAGRAGAQAESDSFQEQYANAEATLRSARALLFETWTDVWETLTRGDLLSTRQSTLIRLAHNNATWSAFRVGQFVYVAGGSDALRAGPIQRLYRDLLGGTQHISSAPPLLRACGRELAGLAEGKRWVYMDLVDANG